MRTQRIALKHRVHRALVGRQGGDIGPFQQNRPARGHFKPRNQPQQRGLAAAGWAQQSKELSRSDVHRNVIQGLYRCFALAKGLDDMAGFYGDVMGHRALLRCFDHIAQRGAGLANDSLPSCRNGGATRDPRLGRFKLGAHSD